MCPVHGGTIFARQLHSMNLTQGPGLSDGSLQVYSIKQELYPYYLNAKLIIIIIIIIIKKEVTKCTVEQ